jgi:TolB protein
MDANGGHPTNLTNHKATDSIPAWSPDGKQIAFVSDRDGNKEIYVMNTDGSKLVNLTKTLDQEDSPTWTLDGKQITYTSSRDGYFELFIMDRDGANVKRLIEDEYENPKWTPAWRP